LYGDLDTQGLAQQSAGLGDMAINGIL
jgi:hypothetical protein